MAEKTWKVLRFDCQQPAPAQEITVEMTCPGCRATAMLTMMEPGNPVIASIGLNLVFDDPDFTPPHKFMPEEIQCRSCRKIFSAGES